MKLGSPATQTSEMLGLLKKQISSVPSSSGIYTLIILTLEMRLAFSAQDLRDHQTLQEHNLVAEQNLAAYSVKKQ